MVISTCDSCNTLISLDNGLKVLGRNASSTSLLSQPEDEESYVQTSILLPPQYDDYDNMYDDDDESDSEYYDSDSYWEQPSTAPTCECCCSSLPVIQPPPPPPQSQQQQQCLYLPSSCLEEQQQQDAVSSRRLSNIDEYLYTIQQIRDDANVLLSNPPRHFSPKSTERILYVQQGEVAHATSKQCDVIVSDKATTCHIVAFRSTSNNTDQPLTTLTHIDEVAYEDCIRNMIHEHKSYHNNAASTTNDEDEEEKKEEDNNTINMDVHIMGGFNDPDNSSRSISKHLFQVLTQISNEEAFLDTILMTLKTCAITSINDAGFDNGPIGRGLGIDMKTGDAFLASVDSNVTGPCKILRGVRLWSSCGGGQNNKQKKKVLSLIHTHTNDNFVTISPFKYTPFDSIDYLLQIQDDNLLLEYTSTSPDVEEDDFCYNVRQTLRYMKNNTNDNYELFTSRNRIIQPIIYKRCTTSSSSSPNKWILTTTM